MTTEELDRVRALFEHLSEQEILVSEYLRQGDLFGPALTVEQADYLRELSERKASRRQRDASLSLFDYSPTLDSRAERQDDGLADLPDVGWIKGNK